MNPIEALWLRTYYEYMIAPNFNVSYEDWLSDVAKLQLQIKEE